MARVWAAATAANAFRLTSPDDVDAQFTDWLAQAYRVGAQEHLARDHNARHGPR